jgi:hypothetical protein
MSRLYRLAVSGKLPTNELTQLVYSLKEIRNAIEAEREAATFNMPTSTIDFTILSVPSGTQLADDGKTFVWPDGTPCAAPEFTPYSGTPALDLLPPPMIDTTPLEVHEAPDDPKIVRLRLREDDTSSGAA